MAKARISFGTAALRFFIAALLFSMLMGIALTLLLFGDTLFTHSLVVSVPSVTEKAITETEQLDSRVFQRVIVEQYSDKPIGTVIAQSPPAGSRRKVVPGKRFASLTLYVSRGPAVATLPNVVGLSEERARASLITAHFDTTSVYVYDTSPVGTVIAQEPIAAKTEKEGTTVTLTVSRGPLLRKVALPNLRGLSLVEAESLLHALGLRVKATVTEESSDAEEPYRILKQEPLPGVRLAEGSGVTLTVAVKKGDAPPEALPPSGTDSPEDSFPEEFPENGETSTDSDSESYREETSLSPEELLRRLLDRLEQSLH